MTRRELFGSIAGAAAVLGAPAAAGAMQLPARRPREIVARDGTRLYHRDWGAGRPIVFLAPWALNSAWWDYHLASLSAAGYRCVAFDRRGHGRSDEPSGGYDFDTLADDLRMVMTTHPDDLRGGRARAGGDARRAPPPGHRRVRLHRALTDARSRRARINRHGCRFSR